MKYDFHYMLSAKYAKGVVVGFIALCSIFIIMEYMSLFTNKTDLTSTLKKEALSLKPMEQNKPKEILNSALFGIYMSDDLNDDDVKKTMLDLELLGVLLDSDIERSQVIIRSANGDEKTYKMGDKLPGGAQIKKIMASGILVERNGNLERLSLPKKELTFDPIAKPLTAD